jgi:hypothetical protein
MRVVQVSLARGHVHRDTPVAQKLKGGVELLEVVHDHMVVAAVEDMAKVHRVDRMGLEIAQVVVVHKDQLIGVGVVRHKDPEEPRVGVLQVRVGHMAAGVAGTAMFVLGTGAPVAAVPGHEMADSPLVPRKAVRELGMRTEMSEVVHKVVEVVRSLELRAELVVRKVLDNHRNRLLLL